MAAEDAETPSAGAYVAAETPSSTYVASYDGVDCSEFDLAGMLEAARRDGELRVFGYGSLVWRPDFEHTAALPARVPGYVRRLWQASPDHRGTPAAMGRVCTLAPAHPSLLVDGEEPCAHGTVFCVPLASAERVLMNLYFREKAGYSALLVDAEVEEAAVVPATGTGASAAASRRVVRAYTFTADTSNGYWIGPPLDMGPAPPVAAAATATTIVSCVCGSDAVPRAGASARASTVACYCPAAVARVVSTSVGPSGSNVEYVARLLVALRHRGVVDHYLEDVMAQVAYLKGVPLAQLLEGSAGAGATAVVTAAAPPAAEVAEAAASVP